MLTFKSSPSIRRHPTIRRSVFLCNISIFCSWDLDICNTTIPNKSAVPTQTSTYFYLKRKDTSCFIDTDLCLWKDAQAARYQFGNSIFDDSTVMWGGDGQDIYGNHRLPRSWRIICQLLKFIVVSSSNILHPEFLSAEHSMPNNLLQAVHQSFCHRC